MLYLRALVFSSGALLSMIFIAITGLLTAPLPFRYRYAYLTRWGYLTLRWLKWTCHLDYEVEGRGNIPKGPCIILCKHSSTWETLVLQEIFPPQVWVLKRELMWVPIFGWGLALLKPIAIDRSAGRRAVEQIIEQGTQRLRDGLCIAVFPEGTRVAPGRNKKWGIGGALLAEKSGYPVVPVAHNAGYYWARRQFVKRPGTIRMIIGEPIVPDGLSATEINEKAESWVRQQMEKFDAEQHVENNKNN
ncbi:MAG: lysophospholipid acyltransferase family protein [Gammaproteobacteria bacterium]